MSVSNDPLLLRLNQIQQERSLLILALDAQGEVSDSEASCSEEGFIGGREELD